MIRFVIALVTTAVLVAAAATPASAHHKRHGSKRIVYLSAAYVPPHAHANKVHYGGKPGLGYWRRGPEKAYGFRFSSYKGDPFGSDDYYDGDRCYYDHHRDFCLKSKIFTGFR